MTVIQPTIFAVIDKFPEFREEALRLFKSSEAFKVVCMDHQECTKALHFWSGFKNNEGSKRKREYENLLMELEEEIVESLRQKKMKDWQAPAAEPLRLESGTLALCFDAASGTLATIENRITGETYGVSGDAFAIETSQGTVALSDTALKSLQHDGGSVSARYEGKGLTVEICHFLGSDRHFAERS